jgi:hypothetical protein
MALWQYSFHLITKESFKILTKNSLPTFDELGFDDELYWHVELIDKFFFEEIDTILNKNVSWSTEIDLYGHQKSNCFEVFFDGNTNIVKSVSFRIDFSNDYEMVLKGIIEFCIQKGLIILDEKLQLVTLNYEVARSIIENSPQMNKYRIYAKNL